MIFSDINLTIDCTYVYEGAQRVMKRNKLDDRKKKTNVKEKKVK